MTTFEEDPRRTGLKPEPPEQRPVQPVSLRLVAVAVGWTIALSIIAAEIVYPSRALWPIEKVTRGLVETTWIVTGLSFLIVLGFARSSGLRAHDLGLDRSALRHAFAVTITTWMLVQATLIVVASTRGEIDWGRPWSLGSLLAQGFGNGPAEELVYRAILLVAIFQALRRRDITERRAFAVALLGSTIVFVLAHAPYAVAAGMPAHALSLFALKLAAMGMVLGVLYATTGNLWLVAWIHALDNVRPDIVDVTMPVKPYGVVALALVLGLTCVRRRPR